MDDAQVLAPKRALVHNLGCAVTGHEKDRYRTWLARQGWEWTDDLGQADLVVLLTCGAIAEQEARALEAASRISKSLKPGAKFLIGGCLPDISRAALEAAAPEARLFSSARDTSALVEAAGGALPLDPVRPDGEPGDAGAIDLPPDLRTVHDYLEALDRHFGGSRFRDCLRYTDERVSRAPWERVREIKIAEGCAWDCAFCVVKRARGRIRSRPREEILEAWSGGLERGFTRFRLIADEAGDYGIDRGEDLAGLLEAMLERGGDRAYEIGIWYLAPVNLVRMFDRLLPIFRSGHVHQFISALQSADEGVLRAMRRPARVDRWSVAMEEVREECPEIFLGTHLIAGFPGESPEAFARTVALAEGLRVDMLTAVEFSPRPGTPASEMPDQVDPAVRLERARILGRIGRRKRLESTLFRTARHLERLLSPHRQDVLAAIGRLAIEEGGSFANEDELYLHLLDLWKARLRTLGSAGGSSG